MQDIHERFFDTYEEAIAAFGSDVVRVRLAPPPSLNAVPCTAEQDLVNPQVPPMRYTEVLFRLEQFYIGDSNISPRTFWRYVRHI